MNVICVFNTDQVEDVIAGPGGGVDAIAQGGTGARIFVVTTTCDPDQLAALAGIILTARSSVKGNCMPSVSAAALRHFVYSTHYLPEIEQLDANVVLIDMAIANGATR